MSNNLNDDVKNASRAASNHENTSQDPKAPKMLKPRIDTFERKPKMKDPHVFVNRKLGQKTTQF